MNRKELASTPLYLEKLNTYLTENYSNKKGLWNYSSNNTLGDDWLLATPFNVFGVPYANFKQAVAGDYPLFNLSSKDADATDPTQQSVAVQATVTKPGDTPVKLLEGHSYRLYNEMYSVMINAKIFLDITTLTPPTSRFLAALTNALTYICNKPENQRPIIRILYSNWIAPGFPKVLPADEFLKSILQNVDPAKKLTVYAGAINAGQEKGFLDWALSWNHSKIVAADGQAAIVGGHNMWGEHYLEKNPVFDVSLKMHGESATHAQDYADKLWRYLLWRINDSFFDKVLQAKGISFVNTAAYAYDSATGASTVTGSYTVFPKPDGTGISFVPNPKGQPEKDVYTRAKAAFPPQSGTIPIISIGREAGMDLSQVFPDQNSYLSEAGEPADQSMYQLFSMAQNKIRMSLQSFSLLRFLDSVVRTWDYKLFYEMAKAVRRGVTIEVVLSNPGATAGGLGSSAPYDGEDVKDVNTQLRDVLNREFYQNDETKSAEYLVSNYFFVGNLRFSPDDDMYPDKKENKTIPLPNHAKTFMVDDRVFYIGSQNQYRCNLAEFGFMVEDTTTVRYFIDNYWTKLWDQSKRTLKQTFDGSLEKFQKAEGTVFILDLLDNKRLDKIWQKAIKDYTDAETDAKAPYLATLNDIISTAGYQTTADVVIELTKTPFFTNIRPNNTPNPDSDRFVLDLLTKKDLLAEFAELIDSITGDEVACDEKVNQFLKNKNYNCTVLQVYASFIGIRGSNLNYFKGEYVSIVKQDGGAAFDFRTNAERAKEPELKRKLMAENPDSGQPQKGPVLLIESDQSVKLDGVALLKPTYVDNVLTWNQTDGNATSGSITFSEIPRPGLKDPFSGIECFGEITYPDRGAGTFKGMISFYARKEVVKDPDQPDDPTVGPVPDWVGIVSALLGLAVLAGLGYFIFQKLKRCSKLRQEARHKKDDDKKDDDNDDKKDIELKRLTDEIDPKSKFEEGRTDATKKKGNSTTKDEVRHRNVASSRAINEANATNEEGWASESVQGTIKKDVDHYVARESDAVEMNKVQSRFEQQFTDLVDQSIVDNDFARESSQVAEDILKSNFKNQVRENVTNAFREQIGQTVTQSMIKRMGNDDYKKYATKTMGTHMEASIKSQLSDPMVDRMENASKPGGQSYLESLLTAEVTADKAEYLKNPDNKSALQADISKAQSDIEYSQKQTASEKSAVMSALEQAQKDLTTTPSEENKSRVDELKKQVDQIAEREKNLEEEHRKAQERMDELDTDKLEEKRKEADKNAERERGEVFRRVE